MSEDKLKKEILESFEEEEEFGVYFKGSSGELQFAKEFISESIDRVREEEWERIKADILSEKEHKEMTMGCFYQDELRENYRKILQSLTPKDKK